MKLHIKRQKASQKPSNLEDNMKILSEFHLTNLFRTPYYDYIASEFRANTEFIPSKYRVYTESVDRKHAEYKQIDFMM